MNNEKLIVSIDLGGTTAKIAFADMNGKLKHKFVVDTKKGDETIPNLNQEIRKEAKKLNIDWDKNISAIGFGCVGALDLEKGISLNAGKIDWFNYPVRDVSEREFKKPTFLINDARAIAYGEWKQGAGRKYHTFLIFSIGTGIGGGIVLNNQLYQGAHGLANEFGHGGYMNSDIPCACGLKGCAEGLSSSVGIQKYMQMYIEKNPNCSLAKRQTKIGKKITILDVADLIKSGDKDTTSAISYALKPLAGVISMMIFAFDPQAVLIGGGPSALGDPLIKIIDNHLSEMLWPQFRKLVDIKICELKNEAGMIGVAEFTLDELKKTQGKEH